MLKYKFKVIHCNCYCLPATGRKSLNSGGSSSSVQSLSEKQILLILQLAWICTLQGLLKTSLPEGFDVVGSVGSSCEIRQVELNLIPALVQTHGHRANEGLYSGGALVVRSSEPTAHVLVVQHLHFEGEVLLQLYQLNTTALTFLMIMTKKGSLIPKVLLASAGQVMKLVETLVPMISRTEDWMSGSVILLMCPFLTDLSQI